MTKPTVHLNGTAAADLLAQYTKAHSAVQDAMDALSAAAPHGRDYYPQDTVSAGYTFRDAQQEHRDRYQKLWLVQQELQELMEHVWEKGK